jgi:hypothetical protein
MMGPLSNIRVFHQPRNYLADTLAHSLASHTKSDEHPIELYTFTVKACCDEIDRLQAIEYEYNAMVAEQNASRGNNQ